MQLPRVKIQFLTGQLGTVGDSPDGLFALVCGAAAVGSMFTLNTAYEVTSMDSVQALGLSEENNEVLWKHLSEFYDEAGAGVKLVVMGVSPTTTMTALLDYTKTSAGSVRWLVEKENGALRGVGVTNVNMLSSETSQEGIDKDVLTAAAKAQQLGEWATTELYAPMVTLLEGRNYTEATELHDLTKETWDRVGIVVSDTKAGTDGACMGTLLGRAASVSVQRNIGRVKDGSLKPLEMYVGEKKTEEASESVRKLYEKGYIVARKYVGRSGYYWADDNLACDPTEDYAKLALRRVIDKAYRTAYDTLLDMLLDELEVNEDGTLDTGVVKSWQQTVETAINRKMTANGELSSGSDGEGCVCKIDETQNVLATSMVKVTLKVRPYGYARYVDVNLGFQVTTNG